MDGSVIFTLFFFLLFFVGAGAVVVFLNGRRQKVQAVRAKVEAQGWQWLSGNTTDFTFQGVTKGRKWRLEYVNYDLRVIWQTADMPSRPVVLMIEPRKGDNQQMRSLAIGLLQRLGHLDRNLKIKEVFVGSEAFHRKFITLSSLPSQEAQTWVTADIEEKLLRLPPDFTDRLAITYDGRSLYAIYREIRAYSPYSPQVLARVMKIGLMMADAWS
jgi:hypothetical protein